MSTPEQKGSFWATIPGFLTGLAALIGALTGLYQVLAPKLPVQHRSSATTFSTSTYTNHTDSTSETTQNTAYLRKPMLLFLYAIEAGNVDRMVQLSSVPFFFNGRIIVDPSDLRQEFQNLENASRPSPTLDVRALETRIENESTVMTVAQLKAKIGIDKVGNTFANSGIGDEDLCLALRGGSYYFFRRAEGGPKLIGFLK
jgi:hypothetical protein